MQVAAALLLALAAPRSAPLVVLSQLRGEHGETRVQRAVVDRDGLAILRRGARLVETRLEPAALETLRAALEAPAFLALRNAYGVPDRADAPQSFEIATAAAGGARSVLVWGELDPRLCSDDDCRHGVQRTRDAVPPAFIDALDALLSLRGRREQPFTPRRLEIALQPAPFAVREECGWPEGWKHAAPEERDGALRFTAPGRTFRDLLALLQRCETYGAPALRFAGQNWLVSWRLDLLGPP